MPPDGLRVLRASQNQLLQATDVLGHFFLAHAYYCLGDQSKSRRMKAELFEEIFADTFSQSSPEKHLFISNGELQLVEPGVYTFSFGA